MTTSSRKPRNWKFLAGILVILLGVFALYSQGWLGVGNAEGITSVSPAEAKKRLAENHAIVLVDVRTPDEYRAGHLANATLIPVDVIESEAAKKLPDRNAQILVYCHSGRRSSIAANILKAQGYTHVLDMIGGITAWNQEGFPLVTY